MTIREALTFVGSNPIWLLAWFAGAPALAAILGLVHQRDAGALAPWRYVYSALVYAACIPGTFALVLTGYALLFTHENLLDVNVLVYVLPIVSMALTLMVIGRRVSFLALPGFGRLSGLMGMLAIGFVFALAAERTHVLLMFGGSMFGVMMLAGIAFAALMLCARLVTGPRRTSR